MISRQEIQQMKVRLGNLSLELLPQIVTKDMPRLITEIEALQAMLFIQQSFTNGVTNESDEYESGDEPVPPAGVERESSEPTVPSVSADYAQGTEETEPVRAQTKSPAPTARRGRKRGRKRKR